MLNALYSTCSHAFSVPIIVVVCFTLKPASSCNLLVVLEDSGTMMLFISINRPCMFVIIQQLYYIALGFLFVLMNSAFSFTAKITGQIQCCHLVSWFHNTWNKVHCACIMCYGSNSLKKKKLNSGLWSQWQTISVLKFIGLCKRHNFCAILLC